MSYTKNQISRLKNQLRDYFLLLVIQCAVVLYIHFLSTSCEIFCCCCWFFFLLIQQKDRALSIFFDSWDDRSKCNKELTTEVIKNRQLAAYVSYYISSFILFILLHFPDHILLSNLLRNKTLKSYMNAKISRRSDWIWEKEKIFLERPNF